MNRQTLLQTHQETPSTDFFAGGLLQRKCGCGTHTIGGGECSACSKEGDDTVQRSAIIHEPDRTAPAPPIVDEVLRSPGHPLDTATRAFMEPRFGQDFSHVRVHSDSKAAQSASAVNAAAYTVGSDVVLGAGRYAPHTTQGQGLLAHELTHVMQQKGTSTSLQEKLVIGESGDQYEQEADQMSASVMQSNRANASAVDRQPPTFHKVKHPARIQRTKGEAWGAVGGAVAGAVVGGVIGGLLGGGAGALIGGLIGAGAGALVGYLLSGSKVSVDNSCKNFCPSLDVAKEAEKADGKTSNPCKDVNFTYQVAGAPTTSKFAQKIDFNSVTIKCDKTNKDCGGWSSKGVITLGQKACVAASCGPMDSTILHEMVHDWAGWGPPYDKQNVTVPGATHTTPDFLDEWIARYVEKDCFKYNPWGLP